MDFEIVIIGAGVVGLSIAYQLSSLFKQNLVVVEKHSKFGQETSSRNSEVIHSGIYYPQNSLKAKLCIDGRQLLYDFCDKYSIAYKKCGKFIVATNDFELQQLPNILHNAINNGVENAQVVDLNFLKKKEPHINAFGALFFPETGIIDSFGLMKTLENLIYQNNSYICYNSEVQNIKKIDNGYLLQIVDKAGKIEITTKYVINASGLNADTIAQLVGLNIQHFKQYYWKGEYFSVINGKNKLVEHLIYPVPSDKAGLGIHATIDLGSGLRLGPNAYLIQRHTANYKVDEQNKQLFLDAAKRYLPFIDLQDLQPFQAGIRPKLTDNKNIFRDFVIEECTPYGFPRFIQLCGIESPGLTSCLAIAQHVQKIISTLL